MGNDIMSGSTDKVKENNFMAAKPASCYNTDSKKINLSDQKGFTLSD